MIFNLKSLTKIQLIHHPVDFRKGVIGLSYELYKHNINSHQPGETYIFYSTNKKSLKILHYNKLGFELWHQKLTLLNRYKIPNKLTSNKIITKSQFVKLISGYTILEQGFTQLDNSLRIA